jgi:hypothetical protein
MDVNEEISEDDDSFEGGWEDVIRKNKDKVWGEQAREDDSWWWEVLLL